MPTKRSHTALDADRVDMPAHLRRAHSTHRRHAAEREIRRWLTSYPKLSDDDRRHLAAILLTESRTEEGAA
jgi:hypothetical protein